MTRMIRTSRCLLALTLIALVAPAAGAMPPVADGGLFGRLDADGSGLVTADEIAGEHQRLFARLLRDGDENGDGALSPAEFAAALEPATVEKPIVEKLSDAVRGTASLRWMLLAMDTNLDGRITAAEVPEQLHDAWDKLAEKADGNNNLIVERNEMSRLGPQLFPIANQTARQLGVDVEAELAKFKDAQGEAADRFDRAPRLVEMLGDPSQAGAAFNLLDQDGNKFLEESEVPNPLKPRFERLLIGGDRNRDGKISRSEFIKAMQRAAQFRAQDMPAQ